MVEPVSKSGNPGIKSQQGFDCVFNLGYERGLCAYRLILKKKRKKKLRLNLNFSGV